MNNFEYIVVKPEKVAEIYTKALARLEEVWPAYMEWATQQDDEAYAKAMERYEEKARQRDEIIAKEKIESEKIMRQLQAVREWENASWFTRGSRPAEPAVSSWMSGYWLIDRLLSEPFNERRSESAAKATRKEVEDMITSAAAQPTEFHLSQVQFDRMMDWGSGKVVARVENFVSGKETPFRWML